MKFLKAFAALAAFVVLAVGAVWLFGALAKPGQQHGRRPVRPGLA